MIFKKTLLAALMFGVSIGLTQAADPANPSEVPHRHTNDIEVATLEQLRRGGNVIFFRHERTDMLRLDNDRVVLDDCTTQRNLSVAGVANSIQTGAYIKHLEIPVHDVFASPMCRTMETARYIFGSAKPEPGLWLDWTTEQRTPDEIIRDFKSLIKSHLHARTNHALVGHINGGTVFGVQLEEGDALVLTDDDAGGVKVVGVIGAHRWGDFIIDGFNLANSRD